MKIWKISVIIVVLFLFVPIAHATSPDDARAKLDQINVPYSEDLFVQKAGEGDIFAVRLFLKAGMDPNAADEKGNTALIAAAKAGQREMVNLLLDEGAEIDGRDKKFGGTALVWAAIRGRTETVKLLLERGATSNAKEKMNGMSALHTAAVRGHTDTVKVLLDKGVDVNTRDKAGRTALMWAANRGQTDTVRLLLDRGADIQAKDDTREMTALMTAAFMGRADTVELLLERGADVNARNNYGHTAYKLAVWSKAKESDKKRITEALKKAGALVKPTKPIKRKNS